MKALCFLSLTAGLMFVGCGDNGGKPGQATNAAAGGSTLSAPADYIGGLGNAKQKAVGTSDTASLDKAIQMFNVDKGRNPNDLQELVTEKYIPRIPDPPVGMKLQYDAAEGKVKVVPQ